MHVRTLLLSLGPLGLLIALMSTSECTKVAMFFVRLKLIYILYCSFPQDIPSGTGVPAWAYFNVTPTNIFNPQIAFGNEGTSLSSAYGVLSTYLLISRQKGLSLQQQTRTQCRRVPSHLRRKDRGPVAAAVAAERKS